MPGIVQDDPEPDRLRSQTDPLIVALIAAAGLHVETVGYRMGRLEMIVETAFVRDAGYGSTRPDGKPVRFWIILHNTRHGLMIRT